MRREWCSSLTQLSTFEINWPRDSSLHNRVNFSLKEHPYFHSAAMSKAKTIQVPFVALAYKRSRRYSNILTYIFTFFLVNHSRQVKCDVNGWKKCRWLKFWLIDVCCKSVLQNVFQGEFKKLLAKRQVHEIQSTPSEGLLTYCTSSKDNIIIILSYGTPTSTLQFS